jgi:hypothetical protein
MGDDFAGGALRWPIGKVALGTIAKFVGGVGEPAAQSEVREQGIPLRFRSPSSTPRPRLCNTSAVAYAGAR